MEVNKHTLTVQFRKQDAQSKTVFWVLAKLREQLKVEKLRIVKCNRSKERSRNGTHAFSKLRYIELKTQVISEIHLLFFEKLRSGETKKVNNLLNLAESVVEILLQTNMEGSKQDAFFERLEAFRNLAEKLSQESINSCWDFSENQETTSITGSQLVSSFELLHRLGCSDTLVLARKIMIIAVCEALKNQFKNTVLDKNFWDKLVLALHKSSLLPILQISVEQPHYASVGGHTIMCKPDLTIVPRVDLLPECSDSDAVSRVVLFEEHKLGLQPIENIDIDSLREVLADGRTFGDYNLHSLLQALKMEIINRGRACVITHHRPSFHSQDPSAYIIEQYSAEDYARKLTRVLRLLANLERAEETDALKVGSLDITTSPSGAGRAETGEGVFRLKRLSDIDVTPGTCSQVIKIGDYNVLAVEAFAGPLTQRWHILPFMCAVHYNISLTDPFGPDAIHAVVVVDKGCGYLFDLTKDNCFETEVSADPKP